MKSIVDVDVRMLAGIAATLEGDYAGSDANWIGSPFAWIKARPSRQIGAIGESLVAGWCAAKGFDVVRSPDTDADRVIAGKRIEIKYSSLWTDNAIFKFQQIRNQNYDYCFCLGISPFDAQAWLIPKPALVTVRPPSLVHQHGGSRGTDTKWLSFTASAPPDWLGPYGGRLSDVARLLRAAR